MKYIPRILETQLLKAAKHFSALLVTGPRRSGKTTLLRHAFPQAGYVLLEDIDTVSRVRSDPRSFLAAVQPPVILDEIQNTPELFSYIRTEIDSAPDQKGRWLMTGSQEAPLMKGVTESMAGRIAVFSLLPLSCEEDPEINILSGGYPEVIYQPLAAETWFRSYIQTYLERDIRAITSIRDLSVFRRFIALLASRCGQMLNKTDLAAPLGISVPTITQWLSILEITGQIILVQPFYDNFGKRIVKTPKLYFADSGLACHLVGVRDAGSLLTSPFSGPLFEGFVASEIIKHRINRGLDRALYYFRDKQGLEVDFVIDQGNRRLTLIEAKAGRTPTPADAGPLFRLSRAVGNYDTTSILVHSPGAPEMITTISPGILSLPYNKFHKHLS